MMKSYESALNDFEKAVLKRMADQAPTLSSTISVLALSSRKLTGVGSFTNFASNETFVFDTSTGPLALDVPISMPGVQLGLGALLFFNVNSIAFLEIFAYGDHAWDGHWEGFSFEESETSIKT